MNMTNVNVLIKPDETQDDIIAEICDDCGLGPDEHFAFSAIITPDNKDEGYYHLRINCLVPLGKNPFTPRSLVTGLLSKPEPANKIRYVQPPVEQWLTVFRPLLMRMVGRAYPRYENIIREREELLSILYLTVMKLYNQDYYLHQTLIYKSFINELNMECRKLKGLLVTDSLDAPIDKDDDGKPITLMDQIADPDSLDWARNSLSYTEKDYWNDMYESIKAAMLEDMSELQFERILLQLKTMTVDRSTSYKLDKYRQIFNPDYTPRPNAKGKNRGGKKK
jgi:hypothetical protein